MGYNMPDMAVSNAEKDSLKFGLEYGKYIEGEWFSSGRYQLRRSQIEKLREHLSGEVDASEFKPMFTKSKDANALGIDWTYMSHMPRVITSVVEGFSYDMYRTSVKGIDAYSSKQRSNFKKERIKDMLGLEASKKMSQALGYDLMPKGYVPNSIEELNVYMELEYKMGHEIAMELGIQKVFEINDWRELFNMNVEELSLIGQAQIAVEYDSGKAINQRYVRSEDFIYSEDYSHTRDGRGRYYFGEVRTLTVAEVVKMGGGHISMEEIRKMVGSNSANYAQLTDFTAEDLSRTVEVISFVFKTTRDRVFKEKGNKHGSYKLLRKEDDWTPPKDSRSIIVNSPYDVWYEGVFVCGTETMLKYGLVDNMMRDPRNDKKALSPYIMYKLSTSSLGERIKNICDEIYITKIKLRQLIQKLRPHGIAIDIDGLSKLTLASGEIIDEKRQVELFNEDGNLLFSSKNLIDDSGVSRPPIHDLAVSNGSELKELVDIHNMYLGQLNEITGINPQAMGAAPPSRTSEGVYQGTLAAAQRVVNNIYNGNLSIQQRVSECSISRLQSASVHGEMRKLTEAILGEYTSDMLRELANIHKYQYVLNIDVKPTNEEKAKLQQDLAMALQTGTITIADKIEIETIENIKLARQMIRIKERQKIAMSEKMKEADNKRQIEQINAAKQAEIEKAQMLADIESKGKLAEIQAKGQIVMFEASAKMKAISLTKQWDLKIAQVTSGQKSQLENVKEDRKDKRTKIQAEQQSELVEQRQNQSGAKKFVEPEIPQLDNINYNQQ